MIRNLFKNLKLTKFLTILALIAFIPGCGIYKPVDARKVSPNAKDRAEKNIQTGKGFKVFDTNRNKAGGVFQFASSNPRYPPHVVANGIDGLADKPSEQRL